MPREYLLSIRAAFGLRQEGNTLTLREYALVSF